MTGLAFLTLGYLRLISSVEGCFVCFTKLQNVIECYMEFKVCLDCFWVVAIRLELF